MGKSREELRKELRCILYPLGSLKTYKYVVVCSFYEGKLMLSRHRCRQTWETQGGHIEEGETPADAAKRELYEESGAADAELIPVCDYYGYDSESHSNGVVFAARVRSIGALPASEMREIGLFDEMPAELTYPGVTPRLFEESRKALQEY